MRELGFSLELIAVDTKRPFKEHTGPKGETFAEVEPDVDYYIKISSMFPRAVTMRLFVDDECLGYSINMMHQSTECLCGLWSVNDGFNCTRALRFAKTKGTGNGNTAGTSQIGNVTVQIFECIIHHGHLHEKSQFHGNKWKGGQIELPLEAGCKKGAVRSEEGHDRIVTKEFPCRATTTSCGHLLMTMTLNYCTVHGLIHAGVLARPPFWCNQFPRKMRNRTHKHKLFPKPTQIITRVAFGGIKEERRDFFDLTQFE